MSATYAGENAIARKAIELYIGRLVDACGGTRQFLREMRGTHIHSVIVVDPDSGKWLAAVKYTIEIDERAEAIEDAFERGKLG